MRLLPGRRPTDLGVRAGRFTAAQTGKPNWVCSQIDVSDAHYIASFTVAKDAMAKIKRAIEAMPRAVIVKSKPDYLHAEFESALLGYVDDVEFLRAGNTIHVRSSSRLGRRDFGVNRKRIETIRSACD